MLARRTTLFRGLIINLLTRNLETWKRN